VEGNQIVFGFAQTLFGTRATGAALGAHAQRIAQVSHGFGTITHSSMDMSLSNGSANTDIHRESSQPDQQ